MNQGAHWSNIPATGSFRLVRALVGKGGNVITEDFDTKVCASSRGNALEVFSLAVIVALAALGVVGSLLVDALGHWGLLALLPMCFLVMHTLFLLCSGTGHLLCVLGVFGSSCRSVFTGISFSAIVVAAAIWQLLQGMQFAWLAIPLLGFVALEILLFPVCRLLDFAEDSQ